MPDTRTLHGVELVKVGSWEISTGDWTVTAEDLRSAVDAHHAGVLRKPVVKLGHIDERFDGEPSLGYVDNLRLADNGHTLVGDLVLPTWLAAAAPMHYPDRSVEGLVGYEAPDGRRWPLVLAAVSLLGATAPGIENLESLQALVAAAHRGHADLVTLRPRTAADHRTTVLVAAARRRRTNRKVL
ncbi:hypothetical protein J8M97_20515 [Gordonia polyisoprenivorans]|uniref:hypothetical protein n=1 Tax=Gordonia polyisoprenivorans TaxID=84595 RepID=UPI001B8C8359|nr:hypothetical protein [Gordonia polyisoprenivorans]QUD82093.1 hypothetical protein J8M97_20515 [Gordonia polyisoprenivorans]